MAEAELAQFRALAVGHHGGVRRHEQGWVFRFGRASWLTLECPWRIVVDGRMVLASEDDGQRFGGQAPIDIEARANAILGQLRATSVAFADGTADIQIVFDGDTRIDVFNDSMGYEGWQAGYRQGDTEVSIVCGGGGRLGVFRTTLGG